MARLTRDTAKRSIIALLDKLPADAVVEVVRDDRTATIHIEAGLPIDDEAEDTAAQGEGGEAYEDV